MFFCTIINTFKFKKSSKGSSKEPLEDNTLPTTSLTHTSPTKILEYCLKIFRKETWKGGGAREILNFKKYFLKITFEKKIGSKS
jgi:hypothetical protein